LKYLTIAVLLRYLFGRLTNLLWPRLRAVNKQFEIGGLSWKKQNTDTTMKTDLAG